MQILLLAWRFLHITNYNSERETSKLQTQDLVICSNGVDHFLKVLKQKQSKHFLFVDRPENMSS